MRNKKLLSMLLAATMVIGTAVPAFATTTNTNNGEVGGVTPEVSGTDVMAGIAIDDPDTRIKVTVPTLFAFVVNGTVTNSDNTAITETDGTLLLPNVKVDVTTTETSEGQGVKYNITTVAENANALFSNYSTKSDASGTEGRKGIDVKISGYVENQGTAESRNYWTNVITAPTNSQSDFKKFQLIRLISS